ncbi:ABC transporter substrate-binding protein [Rhizobium sp. YJ-22]|uniref:ABC transporter substrate-binding protein n=1 Tax=Rhizobium sp. YJ-22 TaxID=3037556 RepID=UPI001AC8C425|nr:ABC transporter substrate-binding protein [Rhizobium sp. YJ-22]MBN9028658.1 ABC transporter substrate-binding protein [Hyphomicrobiales bacterium]MDG3576576.1 ABC transporter substrate-binding protein [Rhizobium sp. YJ-22]
MNSLSRSRMRAASAVLHGAVVMAMGLCWTVPAFAADVIRVVSPFQTTTLDPMRSAAAGNIETYGQLYSRLLRRDAETGALEPGLAEKWDISPDGKTYTFHLRDAQFSDGSPITAADVAFSLERIRTDKKSAYPAPLGAVEAVSAADAKTVVVTLKSAFAPFLGNAEIWNMGIVSKADVDKRGEEAFASVPVTSGPYEVKQWKPNEKLVLEPNPHYWRKGYPKSDATVELIEIASPETRIAMLKAGEIDVVRAVPWAQVDDLKTVETVDMRLEPSTTIYMTLLNHKREPFSNLKARQAAGMAIDNKAMAKAITRGYAEPANTTLPGSVDFHDKDYPGISYEPAKAKELLAESGMAGREVKILATADALSQQMALLIQAQWQAIGLKPSIVNVDGGAWWDATGKGDYDAAANWWYNETPDPDLAVRWAVCGTCGSNSYNTFYENPKVDALVEQGTREADPAKRAEIYKEIQRITTEEVAQIPLYYAPNAVAYSRRLQGLRLTPSLQWTLEETSIGQ